MTRGIDCATKLTAARAAAIRAEGYAFAGRYLVPNVGDLAWKALTRAEAEAITGAGLRLLTVWETAADRARAGADAGYTDAVRAIECARDVGMPEGAVVYFAVDYDAQPGDYDAIAAYLKSAEYQLLLRGLGAGVYGSYAVVEEMARRGVCGHYWQCVAWSGGRKSQKLHVYQAQFGRTAGGVPVDVNECPDMDAAGIWTYPAAAKTETPAFDVAALTDEQCYEIIRRGSGYAEQLPAPDWAAAELAEAKAAGITDGTYPMRCARRYETAIMVKRAVNSQNTEDDRK